MVRGSSQKKGNRCKYITFGCKVNQYETQAIREDLEDRGYRTVTDEEEPDLVVVNTCTVTHRADRKARQSIYRAAREYPDARLVVVGCYAENSPEDLEEIEGVDQVFPHQDKSRVGALIDGEASPDEQVDAEGMVKQDVSGLKHHTRAWLKIEDGCNLFCNFCIIPFVRGRPRSKSPDHVLSELATLEENGHKEVVLTGIHVGCYGQDLGDDQTLSTLFRQIGERSRIPRIRLSSIEADEITPDLLDAMKEVPNIVPHIHMPLQSGSDFILKRMNRRYDVSEFRHKVDMVRDYFDRPAITTDIIVGFPGETKADFQETVEVAEETGFSKIHVFSYSDRDGTKASNMEPKVPSDVINKRVDQLERLERLLQDQYREQFIGETVPVLAERYASCDDTLVGLTPRYLRVQFQGPEKLQNRISMVQIEEADARSVRGTLVDRTEVDSLPEAG